MKSPGRERSLHYLWEAAASTEMAGPEPHRRPVISIDVDPDRNAAAIVAAWHEPDGRIGTDLLLYRTGDLENLSELVLNVVARDTSVLHRVRPLDHRSPG